MHIVHFWQFPCKILLRITHLSMRQLIIAKGLFFVVFFWGGGGGGGGGGKLNILGEKIEP